MDRKTKKILFSIAPNPESAPKQHIACIGGQNIVVKEKVRRKRKLDPRTGNDLSNYPISWSRDRKTKSFQIFVSLKGGKKKQVMRIPYSGMKANTMNIKCSSLRAVLLMAAEGKIDIQ